MLGLAVSSLDASWGGLCVPGVKLAGVKQHSWELAGAALPHTSDWGCALGPVP